MLVTDVGQCCRDCTTAVRETVYANGTQLRRFRLEPVIPGRAGGLAFQVNGRGVVTPCRTRRLPALAADPDVAAANRAALDRLP